MFNSEGTGLQVAKGSGLFFFLCGILFANRFELKSDGFLALYGFIELAVASIACSGDKI